MRERSMDVIPPSNGIATMRWQAWFNNDPPHTDTTSDTSYPKEEEVITTEDVVTPNFKQRIAAGEIINNPFHSLRVKTRHPKPTYHSHRGLGLTVRDSYAWFGQLALANANRAPLMTYDNFPNAATKTAEVKDAAVQEAYANIDSSEILALATIAESRKTVDFFFDVLRRVYRIALAARRLNVKAIANELSPKELADRYMELRYAVRPLIYDATGLIAALEKDTRSINRQTARGYASATESTSDTITDHTSTWACIADHQRTATYTVSARAGVLSHVEINQLQVFGVDQLLETGWELLPFSFIVDWFVNVGQAISAITPQAGMTQLASWVTTRSEFKSSNRLVNIRSTINPADYPGGISISWSGQEYGADLLEITRDVDPQLNVWPQFELKLDTFKILDLGLICRQVLS